MSIENFYTQNPNFPNRYISYQSLEKFIQENLSDYTIEIGKSYLDKSIYMLKWGNGSIKVIAWSQMHGNESNATHSMLDLLEIFRLYPHLKEELENIIQLDFIFMLNPDGSDVWTRRNALNIDLNRDYTQLSSKEFPLLKNIVERGQYDYALNLHEQRTIFSTDGYSPSTLSFLSPSENVERDITETRKKAMAVIHQVHSKLKNLIPNQIARYNDEFYPNSTGDNFTKAGIPTILYEGGHFPNDYKRIGTRKYYTLALYFGLKAIADLQGKTNDWEKYFEIPENKESHYDIIYRNVKLNTDFHCVLDIAVQYKEVYEKGNDDISFIPIVMEVGDCGKKKGWKEIDCRGKFFKCERKFPKLDSEVDFEII